MLIKNGLIFGESGAFQKGDLRICDGEFTQIVYKDSADVADMQVDDSIVDATGLYVIPGMVDIHLHGCMGYDFCNGTQEAFDAITEYQARSGVTSISPATMTLPREALTEIFAAVGKYANETGSTILGITMEGPFLSLAKKGAQNGSYIHKPDLEFYKEMQVLSGGLIKQVAIAPEEDEGFAFTGEVSKETVISVAHTTAGYDIADKAFGAGATHVTHLFNAMPAFLHRDPGVVGAAFDHEKVSVELICDGVHIHPSMVRSVFTLFGAERICMISDSMMATGLTDGNYSLGGQAVTVKGKMATLEDGTIAGSVSNLHDCLKTAVLEMGISLEDAVLACTRTPARALGVEGTCGSIGIGMPADCVLLDEELNIRSVIKRGKIIVC